jgi:hypothetical protein
MSGQRLSIADINTKGDNKLQLQMTYVKPSDAPGPSPNTKLREILTMPMTPFTPAPGTYRCAICWETSIYANEFLMPCLCKNENLKYTHKKCVDRWVNEMGKRECSVCMTPYRVELRPLPFSTLINKHSWIFFSFVLQIALPVFVYCLLYVTGSLARVNRVFILGNLTLLMIMYVLFGIHVCSTIERYRRKVLPLQPL